MIAYGVMLLFFVVPEISFTLGRELDRQDNLYENGCCLDAAVSIDLVVYVAITAFIGVAIISSYKTHDNIQ